MTLEQAYAMLKKELQALKRENEKLKKGTYMDPDTASLEKRIKQLENQNRQLQKESDNYHDLWQRAVHRQDSCLRDEIRIRSLEEEVDSLKSRLTTVCGQLSDAQDTIAKLKAQMNRDHENSSIPSSQKAFHKKIKNSRVPTSRRPGAQKGHPGHKRPLMEPTCPPVILTPDPHITSCPDFYPTGKFITKQAVDIRITVTVTEYRSQIYRNRKTGEKYHAPFPENLHNEFSYGENVKALAFLLNNYCNVSIDKTAELISGITGNKILLSKGLINSLPKQFADATEAERRRIFSMLQKAPYMHTDFTSGRVNSKNVQVLICTNPYETLYSFSEHKGHEGIKGTPVESYQQVLVHDHDRTFYSYGGDHQECLAHILRYLQDAIDNEPDLTWHRSMKDLLSGVIHEVKNDRQLSDQRIREIEKAYDDIIRTADMEYLNHPPRKYFPDGMNLYERMKKYRSNHLLFLRESEIPYTNNPAERGLRKFKRKFKQAVTFRSNSSVKDLCDCMSIIETEKQRGANLFQVTQNAFT